MSTIFLTGGTGSLGRMFIKLFNKKYKIVVYSRDEFKQYELKKIYPNVKYILGDVRDKNRVLESMKGCNIVIHAAALKHITMGEYQPEEFIKTNIQGTINVVKAAKINKIKNLVLTSTDKAVDPINLYGATKLCAEKIVLVNGYKVVRYGNVFGSRGSVVPHFLKFKDKGFLKLSDPELTRFSITIKEAAIFIEKALHGRKKLYIPKLKSYILKDLAKAICPKCKIRVYGLVKGEKKHELLDYNLSSEKAPKLTVEELKKLINDYIRETNN